VECSLGPRVVSTKAVDEANGRAGAAELSSESSESDGKLYYVSSSSLVYLSEWSSDESGGEESSNWPSDKSGKSNRPLKVAIIIAKVKGKA
jgi:hypothetical protein